MMKGYIIETGYMGYVNDDYMLFASETDYLDYLREIRPDLINFPAA